MLELSLVGSKRVIRQEILKHRTQEDLIERIIPCIFMSLAEKKQIACGFIEELLNKGDLQKVDSFVTSDFIYHNAAEDLKGVENFKKCAESDHITFHDIQYSFVDSIAEDTKVAIVCIVEARHVKEFRGIAATHKKVETVVVIIFHFQDNKIKEAWAVADGLTAAFQLGVVKNSFSESG